jgi:hypothetical protein
VISLGIIAAAVACAKVLSPQYLIWALPAGWLAAVAGGVSERRLASLAVAGVLIAGISTWIFPYHYFCELGGARQPMGLIPHLDAPVVLALAARNLLYVAWTAGVLVSLPLRAGRPVRDAASVPRSSSRDEADEASSDAGSVAYVGQAGPVAM